MPRDGGQSSAPTSVSVTAFAIHGAFVIGTDAGDWFSLGPGDELAAVASTGPVSAVVQDAAGMLTVASWESRLMQLREGAWTPLALAAPALALAVTPRGLVIADAGGGLSLLADASRAPVQELSADQPVVALAPRGGGIAALLATGAVAVSAWPGAAAAALEVIDTSATGRVHALFPLAPAMAGGGVLVAGARGYGLLDGARLVTVASDPGFRVAGVAVFGAHRRALLHSDEGDACIVDERLSRTARLAIGAIAGCTSGDDGGALAWTAAGALYAIDHLGAHRKLADGDVVLGAPDVGRIGAIAIRWAPAWGVRVTRGHVAWS